MSKMFQIDSAENSTGFLFWKVNNLWQLEIKERLFDFGLTHNQFVVLANTYYLGMKNNDVTQIDIAKQVGIDKMLTSNIIKALLKNELITRAAHKVDTRAKTIKLTGPGKKLLRKAAKSVEDFDNAFFGKLARSNKFNAELSALLKRG